jgi:glycosyltransferase involved in cell wall biosynthesis
LLRKRTGEEFGADVVAHTGKPKEAPDSATWELIVVDNGSTDGTRIASEDFAAAFAQPVRLVYERTPGQGNARNAGWKSAEAQIVAYLDDDCYPADDYLDAVVECFAEAPNLGFISGRGSYCRASDLSVRILNVYPSAAGSLLFLLNMHRLIIEPRPHEKNYWRDLWRYRELFCFLAWRDILVRYKQTAMGMAWALLRPFLTMVILTVVFGKIANLPSDGIPYPILVFAATLPWQFFSNSLAEASYSLVGNAHVISKIYFSRLILPAGAVITSLVDFFISLGLLVVRQARRRLLENYNRDRIIAKHASRSFGVAVTPIRRGIRIGCCVHHTGGARAIIIRLQSQKAFA